MLENIPKLEAEESIEAFKRVAMGSATLDDDSRGKISREWWQRAIGASPVPLDQPKQKGFVTPGMRVTLVPKKEPKTE